MTARATRPLTVSLFLYYLATLSITELSWRPALALTVSDWLFLGSLTALFAEMLVLQQAKPKLIPPAILLGGAAIAVGGAISSVNAPFPVDSLSDVFRLVYLAVIWFWLGSMMLDTVAKVRVAVGLWLAATAADALASVLQFWQASLIPGSAPIAGRMTGFGLTQNDLGAIAVIGLIPASYFVAFGGHKRLRARLLLVPLPVLLVSALMLSGSVGALLAVAVTGTAWLVLSRIRPSYLLLTGLVGAASVAIASIPGVVTPFSRFATATANTGLDTGTLYTRLQIDSLAWNQILTNPIIGVGLGPTNYQALFGIDVHNQLLDIWVGAGILGLLGVLLIMIKALVDGVSIARDPEVGQADRGLALALVMSYATSLVLGLSTPFLHQRYAWMPAALLIAWRLALRSERSPDVKVQQTRRTAAAPAIAQRDHRSRYPQTRGESHD